MMRSVCVKLLVMPPKNNSVSDNGTKNLLTKSVMKNKCLSIFVCKLVSLKFEFGFNHYKCTNRINNKSGFPLSPDIVPTGIEYES